MNTYKAFEMHSHTLHSDGRFTPRELLFACKARELDGVLLTDHNTFSGFDEITPEMEKEALPAIRGIEWTTFYGHMLVIGAERYVDWRQAKPHNIDEFTAAIRDAKGAVGIAHPFALGSPFCTGCHWEYNVNNWENIDYIEVWSGDSPVFEPYNEPGFQLWTDLLNQGHRLAATSGRDWHGSDGDQRLHMPVTYLGLLDGQVNTKTAREALRAGRVYVTGGPTLGFEIAQGGARQGLGGEVNAGDATLFWQIDQTARPTQWAGFGLVPKRLAFIQNGGEVHSLPLSPQLQEEGSFTLSLWPGFVRMEVYGDYQGKENQLLAFTSPIYVK